MCVVPFIECSNSLALDQNYGEKEVQWFSCLLSTFQNWDEDDEDDEEDDDATNKTNEITEEITVVEHENDGEGLW